MHFQDLTTAALTRCVVCWSTTSDQQRGNDPSGITINHWIVELRIRTSYLPVFAIYRIRLLDLWPPKDCRFTPRLLLEDGAQPPSSNSQPTGSHRMGNPGTYNLPHVSCFIFHIQVWWRDILSQVSRPLRWWS